MVRARTRIVESGGAAESVGGLVLIPQAVGAMYAGDLTSARASFDRALALGERFHDPDAIAMARLGLGRVLIELGETDAGLVLSMR